MIGDDDFFMQNSDYHYGASDVEKMYGRSYNNDSALIGGYDSSSSGRYESSSSASSGNDTDYGKYCLVGLMIFIAIILMVAVVVPAVTESMANSVTIEDLNITRYIHSSQYDSKVYSDTGYEVTPCHKSDFLLKKRKSSAQWQRVHRRAPSRGCALLRGFRRKSGLCSFWSIQKQQIWQVHIPWKSRCWQ